MKTYEKDGDQWKIIEKDESGNIINVYNSTDIKEWEQLEIDLKESTMFEKAIILGYPNVFSLILKILTDKKSEQTLFEYINKLGIIWLPEEKLKFNSIFENNNFTIRFL